MVRYRLQTLILVVREAFATGAGSAEAPESSSDGGVMRGRMVDRASGSRRVRKSVDAWRYVLDMCDEEFLAEEMEEESDEMELDMM